MGHAHGGDGANTTRFPALTAPQVVASRGSCGRLCPPDAPPTPPAPTVLHHVGTDLLDAGALLRPQAALPTQRHKPALPVRTDRERLQAALPLDALGQFGQLRRVKIRARLRRVALHPDTERWLIRAALLAGLVLVQPLGGGVGCRARVMLVRMYQLHEEAPGVLRDRAGPGPRAVAQFKGQVLNRLSLLAALALRSLKLATDNVTLLPGGFKLLQVQ